MASIQTNKAQQPSQSSSDHLAPLLFSLAPHPLQVSLLLELEQTGMCAGQLESRSFPDGESYLRILSEVAQRPCVVFADLSHPNEKLLPLIFLLETLHELGASSVGLVVPYLSYMRQDCRFLPGETVTSRIFAKLLSQYAQWLVTVDPHLHRYHDLNEIYSIPTAVVQGAPALAQWLQSQTKVLLVGPDAESEQWVSGIAKKSGHPYVIAHKQRLGDREVIVTLPDLKALPDIGGVNDVSAVIVDDVISSGQTIVRCVEALKQQGVEDIACLAVHGIFASGSDVALKQGGLKTLVTTNTLAHSSNGIDIAYLLAEPVKQFLQS